MSDFRVQLFAFQPGSNSQYQLPQPIEWNATMTHSEVGSMTLTYPLDATGLSLLNGYVDVEIRRLNASGVWVCLPQGRFSLSQITPDVIAETGMPVRRFQFQSYAWQLRGILQERTTGLNDQGQREFKGKTLAQAVGILIDEAHAKGSAPNLSWEIVSDSGAETHPVAVGQDVESILSAAHDQGLIDWQVIPDDTGQGRKLALYATLGTDKSTGSSAVDLRPGRDVIAAPATMSALDVRSRALVQGDDGLTLLLSNSAADTPYGTLATSVSASGASTVGQLQITGQAALDKARTWRSEETCQVRFESARWLPFQDYGLGDKVLAPGPLAGMTGQKVQQIVLTYGTDGLGGSVVLGERFVTGPEWLRKRLKQTAGSGWNYNWNPAPPPAYSPPPPVYTGAAPNYPTGGEVVLSSQPIIPTLGDRMALPRPCTTSVAALGTDVYALDTRGPNTLRRFRPPDQEWTSLSAPADTARGQVLVSDGANLYACGGTVAAGAIKYDVSGAAWGTSPVGGATQPPQAAWGYGGSIGGKVYFGGGESGSGSGGGGDGGPGEFVALSPYGGADDTSGGVYTSPDAAAWTWHANVFPAGVNPSDIAHSPTLGVFVARYGTAIYSSPDARSWTLVHTAPATVRNIVWAGGQDMFVAGMDSVAGVLTSPDGSTWTQRTIATPGGSTAYQVQAIMSSPSRLVVACGTSGAQFSSWSDDGGATWDYSSDLASKAGTAEPICGTWASGLSLFVIGDNPAGHVLTSPDGQTWTAVTSPTGSVVNDLVWADSLGLLFALTGTSWVYSSADGGATWTQVLAQASVMGIAWSPSLGMLLAVTNDRHFWRTTDGATFTSATGSDGLLYGVVWAAGEGGVGSLIGVGFGFDGLIATSDNGTAWSEVATDAPEALMICAATGSGHNYLGVTTDGDLYVSDDAVTWAASGTVTGAPAGEMQMPFYSPEIGYVVFSNTAAFVSTDLTTWTEHVFTADTVGFVCYSPELHTFLVGTGDDVLHRSTDGTTWTDDDSFASDGYISGACWSPALGLFVVSSEYASVYTSPDGVTWTTAAVAESGNFVAVYWLAGVNRLVAVTNAGTDPFYLSADGNSWAALAKPSADTGTWFLYGADDAVLAFNAAGYEWTTADLASWTDVGQGPASGFGRGIRSVFPAVTPGTTFSAAFHAYDGDSDTWSALADGPAVSHAGFCVIGGKLFVFGGRDGTDTLGGYSAGLWCYDPADNSWTTLATGLSAVSDPAVCAANGKLYVLGGEYYTGTGYAPIANVHIYDTTAAEWASSVALAVVHTAGGACTADSYLYVVGGVADGYHDHEADILTGTDDTLFSDVLTVWMSPPSPISTYSAGGGGWGPLVV